MAVNDRYQDRQGEWQEVTSFIDLTMWGDLAENAAESLGKGARVVVFGRLRQDTWTAEDGTNRSRLELTVEEIGPSLRFATAEVTKVTRTPAADASDGKQK
jgi:single-strand DNA-binding protein